MGLLIGVAVAEEANVCCVPFSWRAQLASSLLVAIIIYGGIAVLDGQEYIRRSFLVVVDDQSQGTGRLVVVGFKKIRMS